jgi:hypothetical protein
MSETTSTESTDSPILPYRVTLTHEALTAPFVVDLKASSAKMAERRARAAAMHSYRHAEFLSEGSVTVEVIDEATFNA